MVYPLWRIVWQFLVTLIMYLTDHPAIPFLYMYSKKEKHVHTELYMNVYSRFILISKMNINK